MLEVVGGDRVLGLVLDLGLGRKDLLFPPLLTVEADEVKGDEILDLSGIQRVRKRGEKVASYAAKRTFLS